MERPSKKVLLPLLLVSIIIPVGLFIGFNQLSEPTISHELSANIVEWNFTRPDYPYPVWHAFYIAEWVNSSFNDDVAKVEFCIFLGTYHHKHPEFGDHIELKTVFSANLTKGFVYKLQILFSSIDKDACLDILGYVGGGNAPIETRNLSLISAKDYTTEPYVNTIATAHPDNCYLKMFEFWHFFDENNVDHEFTVTAKILIYNNTEYVELQLPIKLKVLAP